MTQARVQREGDALRFAGALVRDAVPALWPEASRGLEGVARFDLAGVERIDSAGIALLAELAARAGGVSVEGSPVGLAELRAAYRLSPTLSFAAS
ncbi:STAS domain-containing protein [Luteimonas sp. RIT-PG2_3]